MKLLVRLCRLLVVVLAAALSIGHSTAATKHGLVKGKTHNVAQIFDQIMGSKTVKDKLAEMNRSPVNKNQQIVILGKSGIAGDIPEGDLHKTTSSVTKIGDVTVVVNTTISKIDGGDSIMIEFESEVKPPVNKKICQTDSNCTEHHFCYHEVFWGTGVSYCKTCLTDGGNCQEDNYCCGQTLCRWRRCREADTRGQFGTICSKAGDCGENGCCALVEGFQKPVCRPLANEGQRCDMGAPKAKADKAMSSVLDKLLRPKATSHHPEFPCECPCVTGLKCASYLQRFNDVLGFNEASGASTGGTCVPGWAWPDQTESSTK